jgi:E3 ubiquitin-protein ligase HUWE1
VPSASTPAASEAFIECNPFDRLFKVLRLGDTATNLGNAMDQLMRHQLLEEVRGVVVVVIMVINGVDGGGAGGDSDAPQVCALGRDPCFVCWKPVGGKDTADGGPLGGTNHVPLNRTSRDKEEREMGAEGSAVEPLPAPSPRPEKQPVPVVLYALNAMNFVD